MLQRHLPAVVLALAASAFAAGSLAASDEPAAPMILAAAASKPGMPDLPPPPQGLTKEELDSLPPVEASTRRAFTTPASGTDQRTPAEQQQQSVAPAKR